MLSLYFCCDGYADDEGFKEDLIAPVSVSYDSKEAVELRIFPWARTVRFAPYPFDVAPLNVGVRARRFQMGQFAAEEEAWQPIIKRRGSS